MSSFLVEGKAKLSGSISVTGNKNEALPLIAAALLCSEEVELENVPEIGDVRKMLKIASVLGAQVGTLENNKVTIKAATLKDSNLPVDLSTAIRASVLFASSLLVRTGRAVITEPGGDLIGRRRLDTHFLVFKALGARLEVQHTLSSDITRETTFILEAPEGGLKGADIYLDEASVTATENALIAAAGAKGTTVIANAASEPHVQGLCKFLQSMGVQIEGVGSNILTVHGVTSFCSSKHRTGADYIEAGSFIGLAAATGSSLTITDIDPSVMRMVLFQFERIGVNVIMDRKKKSLHVPQNQHLTIRKDLGGAIPHIEDSPWPGFPSDLMSILLVTAIQSEGTCLIHEKMFESRLFFVDKLISMGASIVLCDPHRAVIVGKTQLYGATFSSPDIRAGMALLIAAMAADGKSLIHNIEQIDRGYQQIDTRLNALGAKIKRID
ncbi:UDP-N-acetylglucosamine 1-carboxyvinyltransferase [Chitinispirillales bacterium ANBcel5]|uniref:UDP-N-acetylglucosamine 1-carboxyvinyltransferase n=1 Tax=Cellulosispirillum alkaliphilum TaxID=3039283 RepID=UPI002A541CC0|nr:UDP-N-acetylglucosamine 1-carboxyvinyltransferase [Chitinispirillales bacterium ANBcel5]